jgi:hypothetical protein
VECFNASLAGLGVARASALLARTSQGADADAALFLPSIEYSPMTCGLERVAAEGSRVVGKPRRRNIVLREPFDWSHTMAR